MKSPEQQAVQGLIKKWSRGCSIEAHPGQWQYLEELIAAALQSKQAELDDTKHNLAIADAAYDLAKAELNEAIEALRPFAESGTGMSIEAAELCCRQAAAIVARHDARREASK